MDCITPSNPNAISPGESIDIVQLLARGQDAFLDPAIVPVDPPQPDLWTYTPRTPVMETLTTPRSPDYLRAQISSETAEYNKIIKMLKQPGKPSTSTPKAPSANKSQQPRAPRKRTVKSSAVPVQKQTQRHYTNARSLPTELPMDWDAQENLFLKNPFAGYDDMPSGRPITGNTAINIGLMKGKLPNGVDARANWISGH